MALVIENEVGQATDFSGKLDFHLDRITVDFCHMQLLQYKY